MRDMMNSLLAESFVRPDAPPAIGEAMTLPLEVAEPGGEFVLKSACRVSNTRMCRSPSNVIC